MEHGATCMSCWTPNASYCPQKNLGQITLRCHQIWLAGKSTMYKCVVYRWFPQLISNLLLVRGFQIATFDDRKDPESCRWKKTLYTPNKVLMTKWPQRNCQNKDALGRSNRLRHTCGKYKVGHIGKFPDIKWWCSHIWKYKYWWQLNKYVNILYTVHIYIYILGSHCFIHKKTWPAVLRASYCTVTASLLENWSAGCAGKDRKSQKSKKLELWLGQRHQSLLSTIILCKYIYIYI